MSALSQWPVSDPRSSSQGEAKSLNPKKQPTLSVVVASYNAEESLEQCLEALITQPEATEIVVSDCSPEDPTPRLQGRFPEVKFVHFDSPKSLPELRWAVLDGLKGEIVGTIEARCIPEADWCATVIRAHQTHPDAATIGGPVGIHQKAPAFELGMYFSEHVAFAPPVAVGPSTTVCDANLSYKRSALNAWGEYLDSGVWEATMHEEARRDGATLALCDARVQYRHVGYGVWTAIRQRFEYGRSYAAERVASSRLSGGLRHAACCPLLPFVLTWRNWRAAHAKGLDRPFLRSIGWTATFNALWSLGEFAGYAFGRPARTGIY